MVRVAKLFSEVFGAKYMLLMPAVMLAMFMWIDKDSSRVSVSTIVVVTMMWPMIILLAFVGSPSNYNGFLKLAVSLPEERSDIVKGLMACLSTTVLMIAVSNTAFVGLWTISTGDIGKIGNGFWMILNSALFVLVLVNLLFPYAVFKSHRAKNWMLLVVFLSFVFFPGLFMNLLEEYAMWIEAMAALVLAVGAGITAVTCYRISMKRMAGYEF